MSFTLPTLPMIAATPEQFQIWWQEIKDAIEAREAAQDAAAAQLEQVVADLADAVANLQNVIRDDAITSSYTSPGTVLSATESGGSVTITIAAHTRYYGDNTSVSVSGGSLAGRNPSTTYYIYYTQASRAGGSVTYHSTTNPNTALPNAAVGRHFVGAVTTPASGSGGSSSGGFSPPSGGGTVGFGAIP